MKILLVNHNKSLLNAVNQSFHGLSYTIRLAEGINTVVDDIQKHNAEAVIINWAKADFDVVSICKRIKRIKHTKYLYIIIITDREKQSHLFDAIDAGANDVVFRPFGKDELLLRMQIAKNTIKLEDQVKKFRREMIKFAKEDPHTNLLNRRSLLDESLKEMMRASREKKFVSAIMVTITNFKEQSDIFGSDAGDQILTETSRRLQKSCRPYDKLGRVGISDFLLILPDTGIDNARKVGERMLSSISGKPVTMNSKKISVTAAMGISELNPVDVSSSSHADSNLMNDLILDSLIRRAELALQKAKERGKNVIETYIFS